MRGKAVISFDRNARPNISPDVDVTRRQVEHLVSLSDVVKVSEEDLHWYSPGIAISQAARNWLQLGPILVVVTLGARCSMLFRDGELIEVPGVSVEVVDTIGAGDTYMGAMLDALARDNVLGVTGRAHLAALDADKLRHAAASASAAAAVTDSRAAPEVGKARSGDNTPRVVHMVHMVTEIHVRDYPKNPYAVNITPAGKVVPEKGDRVVLRTASKGGSNATSYTVSSVRMLSSYDGYVVSISIPHFESVEEERKVRRELNALDWTFIAPADYPAAAQGDDPRAD